MFRAAAGLTAIALLSACTYSIEPAFPTVGEDVGLPSRMACQVVSSSSDTKQAVSYITVVEVIKEKEVGGENGSQYYFFSENSGGGYNEPEIMSFHLNGMGKKNLYVMQNITDSGYGEYSWYNPRSREFYSSENFEAMQPDIDRIAKKHNVVLDRATRSSYLAIHGQSANLRAYLSEIGDYFQGVTEKCVPA